MTGYEADRDANWALPDANVMFAGDPVEIDASPSAPGDSTAAHALDHVPYAAIICTTSGGAIWFQKNGDGSLKKDPTYLYLVSSAAGITARIIVW